MSKITFRADDDLIEQLEAFDASKSEVMREALREYLGESETQSSDAASVADPETIDELITERVDSIISERLEERVPTRPRQPQDVNVNISLDGTTRDGLSDETARQHVSDTDADGDDERSYADGQTAGATGRKTEGDRRAGTGEEPRKTCAQCGGNVGTDHVYCPNCGEKSSRRVFCDCGDELRSDWGFCPSCGRRTPAADVLDQA
ncbi:CopG family transcriptional regulator [Haloarcula salina]|uniref:CopG family transcriptional regulator n=1 Tax=Haloarcula salina TaxID=1429914 RepID=A0AA41KJ75_9EURY|nr:CopG family transcriptional regulator [Haloarcula salina]MBV0903581.1 CopG family transcriptional regulator [Haloarcula salina]